MKKAMSFNWKNDHRLQDITVYATSMYHTKTESFNMTVADFTYWFENCDTGYWYTVHQFKSDERERERESEPKLYDTE